MHSTFLRGNVESVENHLMVNTFRKLFDIQYFAAFHKHSEVIQSEQRKFRMKNPKYNTE